MSLPRRRTSVEPGSADERAAIEERRKRSVEEPLDVRLRQDTPFPILAVRNPLHGTEYLVMFPTYPSSDVALCTCTDFARRGLGLCKHIEAAERWLGRQTGKHPARALATRSAASPGVWKRIDQALAGREFSSAPASLAWRRPGRLLFAGSGPSTVSAKRGRPRDPERVVVGPSRTPD